MRVRSRGLVAAGLASLAFAWLGPLPVRAAHDFSAHMWLHMIVVAVAAPLLAIGTAGVRGRGSVVRVTAVPASLLELIVVWTWHAPSLHQAARSSAVAFGVEQTMFLASGWLVWSAATRDSADAYGEGIVALLLTSMHMTLLGALFALSPRALYASVHVGHDATTLLEQQHLGGVTMLLVGGVVYLAGGLWLAARLLVARSPEMTMADGDVV